MDNDEIIVPEGIYPAEVVSIAKDRWILKIATDQKYAYEMVTAYIREDSNPQLQKGAEGKVCLVKIERRVTVLI